MSKSPLVYTSRLNVGVDRRRSKKKERDDPTTDFPTHLSVLKVVMGPDCSGGDDVKVTSGTPLGHKDDDESFVIVLQGMETTVVFDSSLDLQVDVDRYYSPYPTSRGGKRGRPHHSLFSQFCLPNLF